MFVWNIHSLEEDGRKGSQRCWRNRELWNVIVIVVYVVGYNLVFGGRIETSGVVYGLEYMGKVPDSRSSPLCRAHAELISRAYCPCVQRAVESNLLVAYWLTDRQTDWRPLFHTCHESKFSYLYPQGHFSNMDVDENSRHSMFWNIELSGSVITSNHTAR